MAHQLTPTTWEAEDEATEDGLAVLVEAANWGARQHLAHALQAAGHRVATCPGPSGADTRCPLASGEGCPAVAEADVVVFALHPSDDRNRECLRAHRLAHPERPVVVDLPEAALQHDPGDFAGCILVQEPGSAESLLAAVAHAVG